MYGLPIDVVSPAADDTNFFMRKMDRRKIVKEVNPIEGMNLPVHDRRGAKEREFDGREGRRSNKCMDGVIVDTVRSDRKNYKLESITSDYKYNYRCCLRSYALLSEANCNL